MMIAPNSLARQKEGAQGEGEEEAYHNCNIHHFLIEIPSVLFQFTMENFNYNHSPGNNPRRNKFQFTV